MARELPITVLEAARTLARQNKESEPNIIEILLFPHAEEVRLVEVDRTALPSGGEARAFYFAPDDEGGVPLPSGIAIIRPEEQGHVRLPEGWGEWSDARSILEESDQ